MCQEGRCGPQLATMSLIAPGIKFWSWRGALHVAQSFGMFCIPGYALYKLNTSEMVRGDLEQKLPKRPDLPMGGNASNRVYSPGEQRLQEMLKKVEKVCGLAPCMTRLPCPRCDRPLPMHDRGCYCRRVREWSWRRRMTCLRRSVRNLAWRSIQYPTLGTGGECGASA